MPWHLRSNAVFTTSAGGKGLPAISLSWLIIQLSQNWQRKLQPAAAMDMTSRAGVEVAEGFLADGVHACADGFAVVEGEEGAAFVFAYETETRCTVTDEAPAGAEAALHFALGLAGVEHGFM